MIQADEPDILGDGGLDCETKNDTRDKQHAPAHGRRLSYSADAADKTKADEADKTKADKADKTKR